MLILPVQAQALEAVVFATDWKPQAEQGGFYQAKALGLYEKAGLDVTLRGGGPGVNICLLYTSDAADEEDSVDLGGLRIIKKKKHNTTKQ